MTMDKRAISLTIGLILATGATGAGASVTRHSSSAGAIPALQLRLHLRAGYRTGAPPRSTAPATRPAAATQASIGRLPKLRNALFMSLGGWARPAADAIAAERSPLLTQGAIGQLPRALVGTTPQQALFDPATDTVYVANQQDGTVSVIDARTCNARATSGCGQTAPTVQAGPGVGAIAIDDATHTIYATDSNSDTVSVIDASTCNATNHAGCGQTPATITVGQGPFGVAFDPATDTLYVTDSGANSVSVIDGATCNANDRVGCDQTAATVPVGNFPFNPAVDPANRTVYVTNAADDTVSMIDMSRCNAGMTAGCATPPRTAPVGSFPNPVTADPSTDTIYVGNGNDATVTVIDGATCNARRTTGCTQPPVTIPVPGGPDGLAINETAGTLYIDNNGPGASPLRANSVSIVPTASCNATVSTGCGHPAALAIVGQNPAAPAVDPTTDTVYVPSFDNAVQILNAATCNANVKTGCGQSTPATMAGDDPLPIAINTATHTAYVGDDAGLEGFANAISLIDTATCNITDRVGCIPQPTTIPMQFVPFGISIDQLTDTIYASNVVDSNGNPQNTISVIDGARCNASTISGCASNPVATIGVGSAPAGLSLNTATHTLYVANSNEQTVSVIDTSTCNATDTGRCSQTAPKIPLTGFPLAVAIDQTTDTIYVLSPGTPGTVSVIDGATCNATIHTGCNTVPPTITVGNDSGPPGLAIDELTDTIYAVNTGDDTVSVINGATCDSTTISGCGQTPTAVAVGRELLGYDAVDPQHELLYVSNSLDDTVSVIDTSSCNATDTKGCGQTPPAVAINAGGGAIALSADGTPYVTGNAFGPVSFFNFERPAKPTDVKATASLGRVKLSWTAPADGGLPIVYSITSKPKCGNCSGLTTSTTSGQPFTTISGLAPGKRYRFKVGGVDAAGTGPVSAASNPVSP